MDNKDLIEKPYDTLLQIMHRLRKECPWDKEQTIESLLPHTIEEVYELADAIINKDVQSIKEELGDLSMHIVFYAIIANELGQFNLNEIYTKINQKLIFRHPHIFEKNTPLETAEEVLKNWQLMKKKEGKKNALMGISKALPAITKAVRIQEKARQNGFDFNNPQDAFQKCLEEINEFNESLQNKSISSPEEEFGDILFSLINYARFLKIDPEIALQKTNQKFMRRFTLMEDLAKKENKIFQNLSLDEKENLWQQAKKQEA